MTPPLVSVLTARLVQAYSGDELDLLFMRAGSVDIPIEPLSKTKKVRLWFQRLEKSLGDPEALAFLGDLLHDFMENRSLVDSRTAVEAALRQTNLRYIRGGKVERVSDTHTDSTLFEGLNAKEMAILEYLDGPGRGEYPPAVAIASAVGLQTDEVVDYLAGLIDKNYIHGKRLATMPLSHGRFSLLHSGEALLGRFRQSKRQGAASPTKATVISVSSVPHPLSTKVFLTHGHDHAARDKIAVFLHELNLKPIIMQNEPNQGQTLIEKFERESDTVYAIVIISPDDLGRAKAAPADVVRPRARQNVVFELGFFFGRLGRRRVAVLYTDPNLERPTNIDGIAWILVDPHDGWKHKLDQELRAAKLL